MHEIQKPTNTPTRRDIIEARLSMNTSRPNGKTWYAAYKLDVKWLLERIDALLAERKQLP